jgi:hypothetical protein
LLIGSSLPWPSALLRSGHGRRDPAELSSPEVGDSRPGHPRAQGRVVRRHTRLRRRRSRADLPQFEKLEAEGLDLREDAEHRRLILKKAGEHGLTAVQLRHHRGEGGQGRHSEPTPDPDRVQARRRGHTMSVRPDLVSRRRRNPAIGRADRAGSGLVRATWEMPADAGWRAAATGVRVARRPTGHPHRAWHRGCGRVC